MSAVIVPVGVTEETIKGLFKELPRPSLIITVTVRGYEEVKRDIIAMISSVALMVGAEHFSVTVEPGDAAAFAEIYRVLLRHRPGALYLIGVTGSRYLLFPLATVLLWYWRETNAAIYLVHGVEGEEHSTAPLPGFFATAMRLSGLQKKILEIIYSSQRPLSGKELIEKYGFTRSLYYVLRDLERKGLLIVRRGRIEKTFPGELIYMLLKAGSPRG